MRSSSSLVAEPLNRNPQSFSKVPALLLLMVALLTISACREQEATPAAINTDYVDLRPDRCPEGRRIYPGREGRSCPSGSLTDFSIRQLTDFGGRPRWSRDGTRIVFVLDSRPGAYRCADNIPALLSKSGLEPFCSGIKEWTKSRSRRPPNWRSGHSAYQEVH